MFFWSQAASAEGGGPARPLPAEEAPEKSPPRANIFLWRAGSRRPLARTPRIPDRPGTEPSRGGAFRALSLSLLLDLALGFVAVDASVAAPFAVGAADVADAARDDDAAPDAEPGTQRCWASALPSMPMPEATPLAPA